MSNSRQKFLFVLLSISILISLNTTQALSNEKVYTFDGTNTEVELSASINSDQLTTGIYELDLVITLNFLDDDYEDIHDMKVFLDLGGHEDYEYNFDVHDSGGDWRLTSLGETAPITEQFSYNGNWTECSFLFRLEITENNVFGDDPVRNSDWQLFFTVNSPTDDTNPLSFPLFIGAIVVIIIMVIHRLRNKNYK